MTLANRLALASRNEKRLLAVAFVLIAVALPAQLVVIPLLDRRAEAMATLQAERELVMWMQTQAEQARALGAASGTRTRTDSGRIDLAELERAILAAPIAPALERLAPEGSDAAQITFTNVRYTAVLGWLQQTGYDIRVRRADFESTGPDRVDAALTVALVP